MEVTAQDIAATKPDCRGGAAIAAQCENVGIGKSKMEWGRSFALAILAGMFIGMGALFMLYVKSDSTLSFAVSQVFGGVVFSLGLICVIVAGAELFTGNVLMAYAAMEKRIAWSRVVACWAWVWLGNLVGSLILVFLIYMAGCAGMNSGAVGDAMINTAYSKISLDAPTIFFRGMMCNILVCLAVWMGFAGRTVIDKIFTTIFPVVAFVSMGFEHCVANMFFLPMGITVLNTVGYTGEIEAAKLAAIQAVVTPAGACCNIALATLGNLVGAFLFVVLLYWIAYHKKRDKEA